MQAVDQEVLKYVQLNLNSDLSLDALSKYTGYSEYHLHRILKRSIGEPIGQYIKRKRLENAAMMLGVTNYSVSKVSELSGYDDYTAFSRAFTQIMGTSVKAYKKNSDTRKLLEYNLPFEIDFKYQIKTIENFKLISYPTFCDYFSREFYDIWQNLDQDKLNKDNSEFKNHWSVLHECPNVTKKNKCRIDIAFEFDVIDQNKYSLTEYPGGKYLIMNFKIEHKYISEYCLAIEKFIINHTNIELRDGCSYFKYSTNPYRENIDYHEIEWYLAIE